MSFEIRPYHPTDLPMLYRICLETGDSGGDATHLYRDPDLIGHYFVAPYAILEPALSFVLTKDGRTCGYTVGVADTNEFGRRCETAWFPPLRKAYLLPPKEDTSSDAKMIRSIHYGHERDSKLTDYPAHLHIDILPVGQGQRWGGKLIQTLLDAMRGQNIPAVHLGVAAKNARAIGFYEHVGFHRIATHDWGAIYGMDLG